MTGVDFNTIGVFIAIGLNIATAVGVFIKLENRLTKLETTQEMLLKLVDLRMHGRGDN